MPYDPGFDTILYRSAVLHSHFSVIYFAKRYWLRRCFMPVLVRKEDVNENH